MHGKLVKNNLLSKCELFLPPTIQNKILYFFTGVLLMIYYRKDAYIYLSLYIVFQSY